MKFNTSQSPRKIKVCWVTNIDKSLRFILLGYLKSLKNDGLDARAVCSPGELVADVERAGIKVKTIRITRRITPLSDLVSLFKLWRYFRKDNGLADPKDMAG